MSDALRTLLNHCLTQVDKLLVILEQEKLALESAELESIATLIEQKNHGLADLEKTTLDILSLMQSQGFPAQIERLADFIRSFSADNAESLLTLSDTLQDKLKTLRLNNEVNGAIITAGHNTAQTLNDLFSGIKDDSAVYDTKGKLKKVPEKKTLSKA